MHCQCEKESQECDLRWPTSRRWNRPVWQGPGNPHTVLWYSTDNLTTHFCKKKKSPSTVRCPSPDFDSKGGHYTHKEHFLSPASQLVTVRFELALFPEERAAEGTQQHRIQTLLSDRLMLNKSDCCQETITAQNIRQIQPLGRSVNMLIMSQCYFVRVQNVFIHVYSICSVTVEYIILMLLICCTCS